MHKLGVNIDHVATLRESRKVSYPDPVFAAMTAQQAGASNITLHIREDRRHAQERDLELLKKIISIKINLEMAATEDMKRVALEHMPDSVTIVPEKREELTTEGGLDLLTVKNENLPEFIDEIKKAGISVSLFIDPSEKQIDAAEKLCVEAVEFNTGAYSEAEKEEEKNKELENVRHAVDYATEKNLRTHVGHGLNYRNIKRMAGIQGIEEFNIGHAIVARALMVGFHEAVKEMLYLTGSR
ncbi:MAG: pyridoxine 5'-phosphate synthase [bacterium]